MATWNKNKHNLLDKNNNEHKSSCQLTYIVLLQRSVNFW